jgi:arginase
VSGLQVIAWPFQDGLPELGMGAGPAVLARGLPGTVTTIPPVAARRPEIARIVELDRRLAEAVRAAAARGDLPLVLAGACVSALGTVAGVGAGDLGVVWLDAHADLDTPEDNLSGFFDVMALSVLTGTGWKALRETIPGFAPVPEERVVLAGVRDLEPYQRARLGRSAVRALPGAFSLDELAQALDDLRGEVGRAYLHVDIDVLDSRAGRANEYAAAGGPGPDVVVGAVDAVFDRFQVAAAAVTAYDPAEDTNGRAREVARRVIARIRERAERG